MLAAMTSKQISKWQAYYRSVNEVTPEDEEVAKIKGLNLSEQASAKLERIIRKRR